MKNQVERLLQKSRQNKTLVQNFSYLSALQVFNMLLPLVTYPYLIRVLGKELYGLVAYSQAIIGYLVILVSFGFSISAVKAVSVYRGDPQKLNQIVSSVMILKIALFLISVLLLVLLGGFIPEVQKYRALFYLSMWVCLYEVIFPAWYFQGIEKMKYITWITLVSRLLFVALIFVFIHTPGDYLYLPLTNGIGAALAGLISLYIVFIRHKIKFEFQPLPVLRSTLKESMPFFVSSVSVKVYVSSNRVVLGAFLGMAEVAYYDLAEKIVTFLRTPQSILSQTIFPKISKELNLAFVRKAFRLSLYANLLLALFTVIISSSVVSLLGGEQMAPAVWVVNILVLTVPVVAMSNIFGIQLLIPFGHDREFSRVVVISGAVYLLLLAVMWTTMGLNIYSISSVTVLTEIFVTVYMFVLCKKFRLW